MPPHPALKVLLLLLCFILGILTWVKNGMKLESGGPCGFPTLILTLLGFIINRTIISTWTRFRTWIQLTRWSAVFLGTVFFPGPFMSSVEDGFLEPSLPRTRSAVCLLCFTAYVACDLSSSFKKPFHYSSKLDIFFPLECLTYESVN